MNIQKMQQQVALQKAGGGTVNPIESAAKKQGAKTRNSSPVPKKPNRNTKA
jgi:hypothetical protein